MNLADIRKADLEGKRILIRVDFNVEFENGKPKELHKIMAINGTLEHVLSNNEVKVALLSHMGRPKARSSEFSFGNFYKEIGNILNKDLVFVPDCIGEQVEAGLRSLKGRQALMLENVRFYKEDEDGDAGFAKKLAENFDIYINEAFGASHRSHSSLVNITEYLPSFAGLNLLKEVRELTSVRDGFERPAVALIGGAKIETKIPLIEFFSEKYDKVLVGGKLGLEAKKQGLKFKDNVSVPVDYLSDGLDIGPETVKKFRVSIKEAKTIVWNGPMGKFEDPEFRPGTVGVLREIVVNKKAKKIAGGGETIQFLEENDLLDQFDFISTGGGAMLEFLVKGTLPALEVLKLT